MSPVLPLWRILTRQPHIRFMDESRTLQGVVAALPLKIVTREPSQFAIDQGHEALQRLRIPLPPANQKLRNRSRVSIHADPPQLAFQPPAGREEYPVIRIVSTVTK